MTTRERFFRRCSILSLLVVGALALATVGSTASAATWSDSALNNPSGINSVVLEGVSCTSLTACITVGDDENTSKIWGAVAEAFNGTGWAYQENVVRNPGTGTKNGILRGDSCTTAAICMTVGSYGTSAGVPWGMAQERSSSSWILETFEPKKIIEQTRIELNGASCIETTWCMAVGFSMVKGDDKVYADKFSGSSWTETATVPETNATLRGVSCRSASYCLAVGATNFKTLAEFWNGSYWQVVTQPPTPGANPILTGVSCVSTTWCMAAGYSKNSEGDNRPFADIWNGTAWSTTATIPWGANVEAPAFGISCVSSSECWVVGDSEGLGVVRKPWGVLWTGSTWAIGTFPLAPSSEGGYLRGVSCIETNHCEAVGAFLFGGTSIAGVESLKP